MPETKLATRHLCKAYGAFDVTVDVSLDILGGELHAIIGPNGAGKTTLLGQLSGEVRPDRGAVVLDGEEITHRSPAERARSGIARSFQITTLCSDFSALDNVALAVQACRKKSFRFWRSAGRDRSLRDPARDLLEHAGLGSRMDVAARALSHGERRQLEIAVALALAPKVLLLDEPLAGVGLDEARGLIDTLQTLKSTMTIVLVEHDVAAVRALADRVTVLDEGRAIATGSFADIHNDASVRRAYLGADA